MLSRHFPVAWACSAGTGAGAAARPRCSPRGGGVCHGPCSWAGYSPPVLHSATDLLGGFVRCRLFRVSDTRSKPLNHEDSINGYPQQLKTRSGTQDRSRQGDRLGKTRSAGSPGTTSPFRASTATRTSGRPRTATASRTCSPSPSLPIRRTRSLPSATPRLRHRPAMAKLRKTAAPSGGGFLPAAFFVWTHVPEREDGTSVKNKRSPSRMFRQVLLIWGATRKSGTAQPEALPSLFSRNPRTARCCVELARSRRIPNCLVPAVWTKTPGGLKHPTEYEQIGILSCCVSIQATRQCCPPCRRECNHSKSQRAGGRPQVYPQLTTR